MIKGGFMTNKFGERIRELRIEKGWSQRQLAEQLGYKRNSISEWEARGKEPDFDMLIKLTEIFHVTAGYLLGIED